MAGDDFFQRPGLNFAQSGDPVGRVRAGPPVDVGMVAVEQHVAHVHHLLAGEIDQQVVVGVGRSRADDLRRFAPQGNCHFAAIHGDLRPDELQLPVKSISGLKLFEVFLFLGLFVFLLLAQLGDLLLEGGDAAREFFQQVLDLIVVALHVFGQILLGDDHRVGGKGLQAEGVVAMVMGQHQVADGAVGHAPDLFNYGPAVGRAGAAVHYQHSPSGHQEGDVAGFAQAIDQVYFFADRDGLGAQVRCGKHEHGKQ